MKNSKVAIAVVTTLFAGMASAASIDYRYEYRAATDYTYEKMERVKLATLMRATSIV